MAVALTDLIYPSIYLHPNLFDNPLLQQIPPVTIFQNTGYTKNLVLSDLEYPTQSEQKNQTTEVVDYIF